MKKILRLALISLTFGSSVTAQKNTQIDTNQIEKVEVIKYFTDERLEKQKDNFIMNRLSQKYTLQMKRGTKIRIFSTRDNSLYYVTVKNLTTGKVVFKSNNWISDSSKRTATLMISPKYYRDPWMYNLKITPIVKLDGINYAINSKSIDLKNPLESSIHFYKSVSRSRFFNPPIIPIYLIVMLGIVLWSRRRGKLMKANQEKEKAQLQLEAVRSQLNPHFLFNALAGIQNLMNNNETERANRYLTRFSRLTRSVLRSNDLISLEEEKSLLDDYLQMEQLRFGFEYTLNFDPELNLANIDIPSMVLQPFLENAVKHGVAGLGVNGLIEVEAVKKDNDLILTVTDNGSGFDTSKTYEGLGFDLSTKRIELLNKVYKYAPISLKMKSEFKKTTVTLTLSKWL